MAFPPTNFCRQFKPLGLMYVITSYQNALKPKYLTFSYGDNLDNSNIVSMYWESSSLLQAFGFSYRFSHVCLFLARISTEN